MDRAPVEYNREYGKSRLGLQTEHGQNITESMVRAGSDYRQSTGRIYQREW